MRGLRVLLVDDHEEYRTSAAALLSREGLEVVATAPSGQEAVRALDDNSVDGALLELLLRRPVGTHRVV